MKRNTTILTVMLLAVYVCSNIFISSATADVYVKVDAGGNAVGGAIMCDAGTCGAGSQYSQLTLQPGEQYVLQGTGQAGIGNNNPNTQVKVDIDTKEWTVTRQVEVKLAEPLVINNQQVISYTVQTVQTFTPATSPGNDGPAPVLPAPSVVEPTPEPTVSDTATITAGSAATATASILTNQSLISLKKAVPIKPIIKGTMKKTIKKITMPARKRS